MPPTRPHARHPERRGIFIQWRGRVSWVLSGVFTGPVYARKQAGAGRIDGREEAMIIGQITNRERYSPSRIADAVAHANQAGRTGVVLIDFSKD
jgi:hypothetical protein